MASNMITSIVLTNRRLISILDTIKFSHQELNPKFIYVIYMPI